MKGLGKQLPGKANFSRFLQFNCSNFGVKQLRGLGIAKIVWGIAFVRVWGGLGLGGGVGGGNHSGCLISIFQELFLLVLAKFSLWRGTGHYTFLIL